MGSWARLQASSDDSDAPVLVAPRVNTAETPPALARCVSLRRRDTRPVGRVRMTPDGTAELGSSIRRLCTHTRQVCRRRHAF